MHVWVRAPACVCLRVTLLYKSVAQRFWKFSKRQNGLESLFTPRLLSSLKFLIPYVCGGARELAFVTNSQMLLLGLVREPYFENHTLPPWNSFPGFLRVWNEAVHRGVLAQGLAQGSCLLFAALRLSWQLLVAPLLPFSCCDCPVILHPG